MTSDNALHRQASETQGVTQSRDVEPQWQGAEGGMESMQEEADLRAGVGWEVVEWIGSL